MIPSIHEIAMVDPVAAYWIARGGRPRLPQLFPVSVSFSDNSRPLGTQIPNCGTDLFVVGMDYDVERPNYQSGIFKAESDYYNAKSPYVDLRIKIEGGRVLYILGDDSRIQTVARHATSDGDGAIGYLNWWTLFAFESARCEFTLRRALVAGEDPYVVHLVIKGHVLPCRGYDNVRPEEAIRELERTYGISVNREPGRTSQGSTLKP